MRPSSRHILVFVLLLATAVGCDTVVQEEAEPPELIPGQAFTVQTELFQQSQSGQAKIGPHFMAAVMRSWPVSTTLDAQLQLPAVLTQAALDQEPTIEEGAWVWAATVPVNGQAVAFTLTGRSMGDQVDWTMEIAPPEGSRAQKDPVEPSSESNPTLPDVSPASPTDDSPPDALQFSDSTAVDSTTQEDAIVSKDDRSQEDATPESGPSIPTQDIQSPDSTFVLYTAQTDLDGQGGSWRLYDMVDGERTNVLNTSFKIEKTNKKEIALNVPMTAPEHGGDSVVYAHDGDQRRLRWVRAQEGQTHRITWNVQSHEGSLTATNYNEGQTACWGKRLDDVTCSTK